LFRRNVRDGLEGRSLSRAATAEIKKPEPLQGRHNAQCNRRKIATGAAAALDSRMPSRFATTRPLAGKSYYRLGKRHSDAEWETFVSSIFHSGCSQTKGERAMNIARMSVVAAAASLLLGGTMAMGQMSGSAKGSVSSADQRFMDKAAQGGMAEVELGQLAEQNGQSQEVKNFGKRMVTDHSKANDQLKQLASQKDVTLPTDLDAKDQATKERLSKLQGAAFDKAYMKDMVMDHKKDVAEFKKESMSASDSGVKSWAGETLPTLESHLQEAEKIAPTVEGKTMGKNGSAMNNSSSAMAH
jgi:putative membrane protein